MRRGAQRSRRKQAGASLVMTAAGLGVLLSVSALAIDLVSLYVGRNEAQRAADAAALAGATIFLAQGCTTDVGGCVPGGPQEAPARQQAIAAASQNLVGGEAPTAATLDVSFSYPTNMEPQINVTVYRDAAHGNPMPTFFAKIFGVTSVDVSAAAKAEAFNPTGSDIPIGTSCLRPFLVPNCDPLHLGPTQNPTCDTPAGYFIDPTTRTIVHPGPYTPSSPETGGVIGQPWTLHTSEGPSQWYLIAFEGQSGANLRDYISQCFNPVIRCGSQQLTLNGATTGPTAQAVMELIHADGSCISGQDTICSPTTSPPCTRQPFPLTGGSNHPNPSLRGQTYFGPSDSIITVAIYDGSILGPSGTTVTVLGYMQLFVRQITKSPGNPCAGLGQNIEVVILSISACGASTDTDDSPPITGAGSPIPIRLIR